MENGYFIATLKSGIIEAKAIVFSLFAIIMLHFQILEEEKYLKKTFGEKYLTYKNKVCRYIGRK